MVDWKDPNLIQAMQNFFSQMVVFFMGLTVWELLLTCWYDLAILSRRIPFTWSYFFWFLGRTSIFTAILTLIIVTRAKTELNCAVLIPIMSATGLIGSACASTLLMIRTLAVWRSNPYVTWTLRFLSLAQFTFLIYSGASGLSAQWSSEIRSCLIESHHEVLLAANFLYTVIYDFIIFILCIYGVSKLAAETKLVRTLYAQGLLYVVVTFIVNIPASVFTILHLNPVMSIIFSPPAATFSVIFSCRALLLLRSVNADNIEVSEIARSVTRNSASETAINLQQHYISPKDNDAPQLSTQFEFPVSVYGPDDV
ncbi:hypothetical protein C8Q75DRAFT_778375 [Abortiporus biennis]|nr:hypothetical protein C8Q75DRAFT_778375 [Abortiporus biennis]